MRPSSRAAAGRGPASAPISPRPCRTSSKTCSAWAAARRGRGGRERGADLRYNMEITLEEAFAGKTAQVRIPTSVTCEACSGAGAKAGSKPKTCPTCGGAGKVRHTQGFFTLERTCVACQGRGQVIDNPCPNCVGRGPRHARAHALGQRAARRRGRHPHPPRRRGRGRRARRAAGRPLHLPLARAAPVLPARRRRPALPRADLDGDGGARRRVRRADHRRRTDQGEGARGHPVRPPLPPRPARACRCCARASAATCTCRCWSRRRRSSPSARRSCWQEFDKHSSNETQPEAAGFFSKVKDFLDGLGNRQGSGSEHLRA